MWHLVCGDAAVEGVSRVIGEVAARGVHVLRDDLAVGPLLDIECPPCAARVGFWEGVWPAAVTPRPGFSASLSADAEWLAGLPRQLRGVTVWHGDSCAEQLLLARVATALEGSALPFWEVACGTHDGRVAHRRAVGMIRPEEFAAFHRPRLVGVERRAKLAGQWRDAVAGSAPIRRWHGGAFTEAEYGLVDDIMLAACDVEWRPLARVMAEPMAQVDGFFVTDFFAFWRARELAAQGLLELRGVAGRLGYDELSVRRRRLSRPV